MSIADTYQDTWSCFSSQERHKTHSVLFTGSRKFLISTPCITGNTQRSFIKFTYFMLYIYTTLHIKFERNSVIGEQDIHFQKMPNFLQIFLLPTYTLHYISNLKEIRLAVNKKYTSKNTQFSSHFSSSHRYWKIFEPHKNNLPVVQLLSNLAHL